MNPTLTPEEFNEMIEQACKDLDYYFTSSENELKRRELIKSPSPRKSARFNRYDQALRSRHGKIKRRNFKK